MENKWKNPNFFQSLKNAINGIFCIIKSGGNIKIQLVFAIIAMIAGFVFNINNIFCVGFRIYEYGNRKFM